MRVRALLLVYVSMYLRCCYRYRHPSMAVTQGIFSRLFLRACSALLLPFIVQPSNGLVRVMTVIVIAIADPRPRPRPRCLSPLVGAVFAAHTSLPIRRALLKRPKVDLQALHREKIRRRFTRCDNQALSIVRALS